MSFLFRKSSSSSSSEQSGGRQTSSSSSTSKNKKISSSSTDVNQEGEGDLSSEHGTTSRSYTITTSSSSSDGPDVKSIRTGDAEGLSEGGTLRFAEGGQSSEGSSTTTSYITSSSSSAAGPDVKTIRFDDVEGFSESGSLRFAEGGKSSESGSTKTSYTVSSSSSVADPDVKTVRIGDAAGISEGGMISSTTYKVTRSSSSAGGEQAGSIRISGDAGGSSTLILNGGSGSVHGNGSAGFQDGHGETDIRVISGSSEYATMTSGDGRRHGSLEISDRANFKTANLVDSGFAQRSRSNSEESENERVATRLVENVEDMKALKMGSISAEDERVLMQDLNARFAKYIDKIRTVEDPEALIRDEVITRVEKIEQDYENQSRLARERIKDLEIEVAQLRASEDELTKALRDSDRKVNALDDELRELKDTLRQKETILKELTVKNIENTHFVNADVEREGIVKQVETVVQHVAAVTTFAAPPGSIFATEESTTNTTQVDAPRFGTPLYSKLMALRAETENLCLRTHRSFTANLGPLQIWVENQAKGTLADLQKMNGELGDRVKDLEVQLRQANVTAAKATHAYEFELAKLRQEMLLHLKEYNALYRTKLTLEAEIATYRNLLEEEEERLSICFKTQGGSEGDGFGLSSKSVSVHHESRTVRMSSGSISANGEYGMQISGGSGLITSGSGSAHGESGMTMHMSGGSGSGSGLITGGSGSAHGESGMTMHMSGGSRSGYEFSGGAHQEEEGDVVTTEIHRDEVRSTKEGGSSVVEMIQSGFDVLSAQADEGLDDINVERDDDSDHSD